MTYTNAIPRVGSANPDKRKMGQTVIEKKTTNSSKKSKKNKIDIS